MLTIVHICLATHGRTLRSRAHAIKGRLMVSWVASCICTTLVRSLGAMALALLPLVGPITLLLPTQRMEPLKGQCGVTSGYAFLSSFFKVLSLTHLSLLMLEFEIAETIPLAEWGHAVPRKECVREECYEARKSIHIKWMDSSIEQVHTDSRGAANECVSWWFKYVSDWRTICDGKTCWS
jgi:hypothetical protein